MCHRHHNVNVLTLAAGILRYANTTPVLRNALFMEKCVGSSQFSRSLLGERFIELCIYIYTEHHDMNIDKFLPETIKQIT